MESGTLYVCESCVIPPSRLLHHPCGRTFRLGWTGGLQLGTATAAAAPMTSLLAASLSAAGWLADANLVNNKSGIPINSGQDSSTHIVDVNDDGDTKDKRVYRSRARMCVAHK